MSIVLQKAKGMPGMFICMDEKVYADMPQIGQYEPKSQNVGTETMLRTWRGWMTQIAEYMSANGATMPLWSKNGEPYGQRPFNAEDAHEAFTKLFLGCDDNEQRYSWSLCKKGKSNQAPKSKRLYAMEKMQAWALNKGIVLKTKENSEYFRLQRKQES